MDTEFDPVTMMAEIRKNLRTELTAYGIEAVEQVKEHLSTPSPPVSQPGDYPHMRTGELKNSIHLMPRDSLSDVSIEIYSDSPVAGFLEYGTRNMAPRPFLGPLANEWSENGAEILQPIVDAACRNLG